MGSASASYGQSRVRVSSISALQRSSASDVQFSRWCAISDQKEREPSDGAKQRPSNSDAGSTNEGARTIDLVDLSGWRCLSADGSDDARPVDANFVLKRSESGRLFERRDARSSQFRVSTGALLTPSEPHECGNPARSFERRVMRSCIGASAALWQMTRFRAYVSITRWLFTLARSMHVESAS
jgi:hypothetical protein